MPDWLGSTALGVHVNTPSGALEGHAMDARAHQQQLNMAFRTGHVSVQKRGDVVRAR